MSYDKESKELLQWYEREYELINSKYKDLPSMTMDNPIENKLLVKEYNKRMLVLRSKYQKEELTTV